MNIQLRSHAWQDIRLLLGRRMTYAFFDFPCFSKFFDSLYLELQTGTQCLSSACCEREHTVELRAIEPI